MHNMADIFRCNEDVYSLQYLLRCSQIEGRKEGEEVGLEDDDINMDDLEL